MAECNYREVDSQLKEQFIHRLNDNSMLDEVIRELTAKSNNEQTTSEDVSVWAKRIEAQWAHAAILSDITELQKFDKVKMVQKTKARWDIEATHQAHHKQPCTYCGGKLCTKTLSSIWKNMWQLWEDGPLQKGMQE